MSVPTCRRRRIMALAVLVSAVGTSAIYAQRGGAAGPDTNPLPGHLVKTGLYLFTGRTNSLMRLSANGLIVVDGPAPADYAPLLRWADRIAEQPIRLLITTDHHREHTASNARFLADGVQIVAHENVARNLSNAGAANRDIAAPTKTYDRTLSLTLGGIGVTLMHFGNAHTNGDSVVYFPNLKVVVVGDLYADTPDPDYSAGGSLVGWGPVLGEILKLDFDVVVPGTGPAVGRADLAGFKRKIDALVSRAAGLVKKGVPKDQLMAQLRSDDLGTRLTFTGERLDRFYGELARMK